MSAFAADLSIALDNGPLVARTPSAVALAEAALAAANERLAEIRFAHRFADEAGEHIQGRPTPEEADAALAACVAAAAGLRRARRALAARIRRARS